MGLFQKIKELINASSQGNDLWLYVKCNYCGEPIKARVDLANQLSLVYGDNGVKEGYFCRKIIIGSQGCYRPIEVELKFDTSRRLTSRKIHGGKFISAEEYTELAKELEKKVG